MSKTNRIKIRTCPPGRTLFLGSLEINNNNLSAGLNIGLLISNEVRNKVLAVSKVLIILISPNGWLRGFSS
ncbi:MAG: hypothetical protein COX90_03270 [Candidatus Nealsonbacteria bacterium CG_4_10_14_0_2_um_filter_38_17]|uniref:Uncharacterized protein n=2 Tax=Candidatus Nealsoniibacteriota TaxID=1817911 RepID=A0A2M7UXI7_9BACT|nr:MAG: hypothetical protein COX36_04770 [Candidatus Nealsonbacteria bacterium CG23_combo_of_CG06-09_8_20_14_all_38_19]PIZ88694.1 MAG: hypothetical protein COX90_03270 [Candidatus Nealsonbacteria bacterium CG_4_10_14_0_2_um_filter_38_17]